MTSPFPICPPRFPDEVEGEFSIWKEKKKTEQFVFQFQSVKTKKTKTEQFGIQGLVEIISYMISEGMGVLGVVTPYVK